MNAQLVAALAEEVGFAPHDGWRSELGRAVEQLAERHHLERKGAELRIAQDQRLLLELAERLSIGESHFFRHREQLERVANRISHLRHQQPQVSLWSAGCSKGQELYSVLALLLDQESPTPQPPETTWLSLRGTDLNPVAIAQAEAGTYNAWSLRGLSAALTHRHFNAAEAGGHQIKPHLARFKILFETSTIQKSLELQTKQSLDVILFRNVAIYLTAPALRRIVQGMHSLLRPGGWLVMAPTDSSVALEFPFEQVSVGVFERQPGRTAPRSTQSQLPSRPPPRIESPVQRAKELADRGNLKEALLLLSSLTDCDGTEEALTTQGQVLMAAGRYQEALQSFQRVGPSGILARYFSTLCLAALERSSEVVQQLHALESTLSELNPDEALGESTSAGELLHAVRCDLRRHV